MDADVSGDAMYNLAAGYLGVGRIEEFLALSEKTLEFRRRTLPADHPDIGDVLLANDFLFDAWFAMFQVTPLCKLHRPFCAMKDQKMRLLGPGKLLSFSNAFGQPVIPALLKCSNSFLSSRNIYPLVEFNLKRTTPLR